MDKDYRRDGANEDQWRARLEAWKSSSLSLAAYCQQERIKVASLRYWKRKLQPREPTRKVVKLPVRLEHLLPPIEVVVAGRFTIRVPHGFQSEELTRLLEVLERFR